MTRVTVATAPLITAAQSVRGYKERQNVSELLADTLYTYQPDRNDTVAPGDIIRTRSEGFSYEVLAAGASGDVATAGGVKLRALAERGELSVDAFGPTAGLADARAEVQAGIDALDGEALILGPRTYSVEGPIYTGALTGNTSAGNVVIAGVGPASIIEKNYTGQGTIRSHSGNQVVAQSTTTFTDMEDLPGDITLRDFTMRSAEWLIGGVPTNTPFQIFAKDLLVDSVTVDNWSGWAFRNGGLRHTYRDIKFSNPLSPHPDGEGNPDGIHMRWGDTAFIENVTGKAGDDMVALGIAGAVDADQTIKGLSRAVVTGVMGDPNGSLLALMAGPDQIVSSISGRGFFGTSKTQGVKIIADGSGFLQSIHVSDFNYTSLGPVGQNAMTINLTPGCEDIKIGPGRVVPEYVDGVNITFIHTTDDVTATKIDLDLRIVGTGMTAPSPPSSIGAALRLTRSGTGGSINGATIRDSNWRAVITGASGASLVRLASVGMEWCDLDLTAYDVQDGQTAFDLQAAVQYCRLKLKARRVAGATSSVGLNMSFASVRNNDFRGSDFRGVDQVFPVRPHFSNNFQGVWGVLSPGRGDDLTISDGAITVTHEEHVIDTEGAASTDDLDVITTIPNLPNGLRLVLRSANSGRDITLRDVTAITADAGAIRAKSFTLGNTNDRVVLTSDNGNWFRLSSEDNS